ncbi:hypothetical protein ACTMU2_00080 [Cupriavidus basilensis]
MPKARGDPVFNIGAKLRHHRQLVCGPVGVLSAVVDAVPPSHHASGRGRDRVAHQVKIDPVVTFLSVGCKF